MRFLKNKILKVLEAKNNTCNPFIKEQKAQKIQKGSPKQKDTLKCTRQDSKQASNPTKNISINYGKAIASFALSTLALPYIDEPLEAAGIPYIDYVKFITQVKDTIRGIESFRHLLEVTDKDNTKTQVLKGVFKNLCEVFIKYFSVNWIMHGKIADKMVYLKFRGKMLRRVQNPESFTYIKKREKTQ